MQEKDIKEINFMLYKIKISRKKLEIFLHFSAFEIDVRL